MDSQYERLVMEFKYLQQNVTEKINLYCTRKQKIDILKAEVKKFEQSKIYVDCLN